MNTYQQQYSQSHEQVAMSTIQAMKAQETSSYHMPTTNQCLPQASPQEFSAYLTWRQQMVTWCYNVVTTCKLQKDVVETTMGLADRYVAVRQSETKLLEDPSLYQLVVMVCLYLTVKVHETTCLTPMQLQVLSGHRYTVDQIEELERDILLALQWRVHPPTATAFCRSLVDLIMPSLPDHKETVLEICETQISLTCGNQSFFHVPASNMGLAVLMNALASVLQQDVSVYYDRLAQSLQDNDGKKNDPNYCARYKSDHQRLRNEIRSLVVESLDLELVVEDEICTPVRRTSIKPENVAHSPRSVVMTR